MRTTYTLSDETRRVLTDHVKQIADEMDCDKSYLYQILSDATTDPFAPYRRMAADARERCWGWK